MTDNLISRSLVIDAVNDIRKEIDDGDGFDYEKWRKYFAEMPPAQPECKDAVSRADVDLLIEEAQTAWLKGDILLMYPALKKGLQKVPPVTPKRKNGRWIYGENDGQDGWYCSECGGFVPWDYDYYGLDNIDFIKDFKTCPRCDARMISYTGMEEGEQE